MLIHTRLWKETCNEALHFLTGTYKDGPLARRGPFSNKCANQEEEELLQVRSSPVLDYFHSGINGVNL